MQTLVLLLVPSVDFYMAIPALRALKRQADGDIHILARESHIGYLTQLGGFITHQFESESVIQAILELGEEAALKALEKMFLPLSQIHFERIVNLSFSPLSSFITDLLATEKTVIQGYSRFSDGTLRIPDDTSAYVFAQVLDGSPNRYHKIQINAATLGLDLAPEDLSIKDSAKSGSLIINLESSDSNYPAELWRTVLSTIKISYSGQIRLVGAPNQQAMATTIDPEIEFIESTKLDFSDASLLITSRSQASARASLAGIPVLFISSHATNFWEYGPWSSGSRVLVGHEVHDVSPERIAQETFSMLNGKEPVGPCWIRSDLEQTYFAHKIEDDQFGWSLLQALYTAGSYPHTRTQVEKLGFQRLFEVSELALQALAIWSNDKVRASQNLHMVDEILIQLPEFCPALGPIIRWFNTERIRLGPSSEEHLLGANKKLFADLFWIASVYREYADEPSSKRDAAELCQKCAGIFREFEAGAVGSDFQRLLSLFHELARFSSKIGDQEWSGALKNLTESFDRRDFIEVADQLEYVLAPELNA